MRRKRLFVSYSHSDKEFVERLTRDLRLAGAKVLIDTSMLQIGDSLEEQIPNLIRRADLVLIVVSRESVASKWVISELQLALSRFKRRIVPIILQPCDIAELQDVVYVDFSHPDKYLEGIIKLVGMLRARWRSAIIRRGILIFGVIVAILGALVWLWPRDHRVSAFAPCAGTGYNGLLPECIVSTVDESVQFILVPESTTRFGTNLGSSDADERPELALTLSPFYISKYEITNAQYKRFIDVSHHVSVPHRIEAWATPYSWDRQERIFKEGRDNLPVTLLSWEDALAYCEWIGSRLPTEFEWEKAARGDTNRIFPWGNDWDPIACNNLQKVNNIDFKTEEEWKKWIYTVFVRFDPLERNRSSLMPVGTFPRDKSIYGVYDMAGNASEWCADWYDYNRYKKIRDSGETRNPSPVNEDEVLLEMLPVWDRIMKKVVRGGSWMRSRIGCRVTDRKYEVPMDTDGPRGFRPAVSAEVVLQNLQNK